MFSSVNSLYWYNKKTIPVELSFFLLASKKRYVISETIQNTPGLVFRFMNRVYPNPMIVLRAYRQYEYERYLLLSPQFYRTIVNNLYSILNLHCILQVRINIVQINYRPIKRLQTTFGSRGPKDLSPFPVFIHNLNHVSVFPFYPSLVLLAFVLACACVLQPSPLTLHGVLAYQHT